MNLYAQLNFGGNCEEAFRVYEKHLGGKITFMMNQSQAPGAPSGAGKAMRAEHWRDNCERGWNSAPATQCAWRGIRP